MVDHMVRGGEKNRITYNVYVYVLTPDLGGSLT